jgi:hypothetical protein
MSQAVTACSLADPRASVAIVSNPIDVPFVANLISAAGLDNTKKVYIGLTQRNTTFEPDYSWMWSNGEPFRSVPFDDGRTFQLGPNGTFMDFVKDNPTDTTNPSCGYIINTGDIYEIGNCGGANGGTLCSIPCKLPLNFHFSFVSQLTIARIPQLNALWAEGRMRPTEIVICAMQELFQTELEVIASLVKLESILHTLDHHFALIVP